MAQIVDINRDFLVDALMLKINSLKRASEKERNPLIKELQQKDISTYTTAMNTLKETK